MRFQIVGPGFPDRVIDADTGEVVALVRSMAVTALNSDPMLRLDMQWLLMPGWDQNRIVSRALPEPKATAEIVTPQLRDGATREPLKLPHIKE